jgi:hypothetical protein
MKVPAGAILPAVWLLVASPTHGREALTMRVSAPIPGALRVHLTIERDAENRGVIVKAESIDFYRSSLIQLDGEGAPRITFLEFRGLPSNMYEVTGVLVGSDGPRSTVMRIVRVPPDRWGR